MLSVVIATLGGDTLPPTLRRLNAGTLVPDEILICIPEREAPRAAELAGGNVRVIVTPVRGQVNQRICGFQAAREPFVLQVDDDIDVAADCLERLVQCAQAHPDAAVAPKLFNAATRQYHNLLTPSNPPNLMDRVVFRLINGAEGFRPGGISCAGVNMGVPEFPDDLYDLDWTPGGCLLHRREHLVLSPFYPYPGKAFAEDLFHCRELRRRGVRLMRCGAARAYVDMTSSGIGSPLRFWRDYRTYGARMADFARAGGGNVTRLRLFLALNLVLLVWRRLRRSGLSR